MNPHCNESPCSSPLPLFSVMRSPPPPPPVLASHARGDSSSRQPAVLPPDRPHSLKLSPYPPLSSLDHHSPPRSLRRRASQGSLPSKPSAVSRFLSKKNVRLQIPDVSLDRSSESPAASSLPAHSTASTPQPLPAWDASKSPSGDYYSTLPPTPPDDDDHVAWNPQSGMLYFESHMSREPGPAPVHQAPDSDPSRPAPDISSPDTCSDPSSAGGGQGSSDDPMDCDQRSGLENGIESVVSSLAISNPHGEAVKIVAQTLPYPHSEDKSVALPVQNIFGSVVQAVQSRLQQGQSPYIHITHAVPEQFSLSNLPSSPPTTPRFQLPRDDYFNSTVFSSAAVVSAYHDFRGPTKSQTSHTPMPVVPPHSVHISVLERFLPPASPHEYKDMFLPDRPSFLVDRLFELSPDGGSMLFIYPTKKGACTFKSQYLGPILDPLLRQLVVVNELPADVGRYLGKLSSVSQMDDFDAMKSKITELCRSLSTPSSRFTLVDGGKGSAHFERHLWTEWYIHQERTRMKEVLSMYWQNGRRVRSSKTAFGPRNHSLADKEVTAAMLLGEILDGIRRRPYESEPREGVELGVFVIRRSH